MSDRHGSRSAHNPFFQAKDRPLVLGHRGVPLLHQENTMAGFRKAVELGIDGVELDVFLTKDGKAVVFHDEDTERLTGVEGNITEMTWDEVSKLRVQKTIDATGAGNFITYPSAEPIPLLEEVLSELAPRLAINVELKAFAPKWSRRHTGTEVANVVRRTGTADRCIFTSFDFFMLHELEKAYPGLDSGFAYDDDAAAGLGEANTWFDRVPDSEDDRQGFLTWAKDGRGFLRWVLEANAVGRLVGSTVVDCEYVVLDEDTVEKFHAKDWVVGSYVIYPYDIRAVRRPLSDDETMALLENLVRHRVDWLETDDPPKLMESLDVVVRR